MALLVVLLLAYIIIPFTTWQWKLVILISAVVCYIIGSLAVGVINGISHVVSAVIHWISHWD